VWNQQSGAGTAAEGDLLGFCLAGDAAAEFVP
jgi:hypothetical protein